MIVTKIKEDFSLMAILLIPVAIAVNAVIGQITALLKLPVYLDAVGTILISVIAGPWVGITTGVLTNLINGIFDPTFVPFAIVSAVVGLLSGFLSKKGMFKTPVKCLISGVILGIISAIISAPIVAYVFGGVTGSGSTIITGVFLAAGKSLIQSVLTSSVLTDLADKLLSVFIVFTLIKAMPSRYLSKFNYGEQFIKKTNTSIKDNNKN